MTSQQTKSRTGTLTLAPVFNFDCEVPKIRLSKDMSIRTLSDQELRVIREYEGIAHALPPHALGKLKFAIDCTTEETSFSELLFDSKVVDRINLVTTAFRIWSDVVRPSFLRIEVSNVLYSVTLGWESIFGSRPPLQIITLRSPRPLAADENLNQFSKTDVEAFAQLFTSMDRANHGRMKVAFKRLKMFTEETWPESIIDAMIAFETLCCDKNDVAKGLPIAQRAATLIGRNHDENISIENFLVEAYKLRNKIMHGEDVIPDHWAELTRMAFRNDSDLKPLLSKSNADFEKGLPPNAAIEALGKYLCRLIRANLQQKK